MANISKKPDFIFLPSAVKESKAYSQSPKDGSGDFTFYRNSTTTRVNEKGLVESWPKNLLSYSEDFGNASWGKSGAIVTTNDILAPNGTLTADKVVFGGANNYISQQISALGFNLGNCNHSIYIKGTAGETVFFDDIYVSIPNVTLTGDWQRVDWTSNRGSSQYQGIGIGTYNSATARTIWLWGAQLEIGSTATTYTPTTNRLNLPTIDYSDGGPTLLLNPERTNLITYSEDFSNGFWTAQGGTVSANLVTAPNGTSTAKLFTLNTSTGEHNIYNAGGVSTVANQPYTFSYYVKKGTAQYVCAWIYYTGVGSGPYATFDLNSGKLVQSGAPYGTFLNSSIQSCGNGWFRISVTGVGNYTSTIGALDVRNINYLQPQYSFLGSGETVYFWGAQLELGPTPSSYIPTLGSTVTRVLEGGITNFIPKSNRVTVYAEFKLLVSGQNVALFGFRPSGVGYTVSNIYYLYLWGGDSNKFGFNVANNDSYGITNSTIADGKYHKVIAVFDYTNFANNELYIDGVKQTISQTRGTTLQITTKNNFSTLYAQGTTSSDEDPTIFYREIAIWDLELTDAECIDLTSQPSLSNPLINKHKQLVLGSGGVVEAENSLNNTIINLK